MHWAESDCQIIQTEYFNECENVAAKWEGRRRVAGYRSKEEKHKNKSCK